MTVSYEANLVYETSAAPRPRITGMPALTATNPARKVRCTAAFTSMSRGASTTTDRVLCLTCNKR